jgi:hypothetical protein
MSTPTNPLEPRTAGSGSLDPSFPGTCKDFDPPVKALPFFDFWAFIPSSSTRGLLFRLIWASAYLQLAQRYDLTEAAHI